MSLGFKQLTLENWDQPDPVNASFGRFSAIAGPVPMTAQDWARTFLQEELKPHVPDELRDMFEVARGALLYGWFFYPLFRLGEEQLYRVLEAAARVRYTQIGGTKSRPSFAEALEYLITRGVVPTDDEGRWQAGRRLRNRASHPEKQTVMPPGQALRTLKLTAHDINRLFAREPRVGRKG